MLESPGQHRHRGVALDHRRPREALVVLSLGIPIDGVEVEGRVLEGMGVLVRVRHPCVGVEAGIGDHHHALLGVVVEAEDLVPEQLELELGDILTRLEQPEGHEGGVVPRLLLRRVVLLEDPLQLDTELLPGDQLRGADLGARQAADLGHLVLDIAKDGEQLLLIGGARLGACGRGGRGRRTGGCRLGGRCRRQRAGLRAVGEVQQDDRNHGDDQDGNEERNEALGRHRRILPRGFPGSGEGSGFLRFGKPVV